MNRLSRLRAMTIGEVTGRSRQQVTRWLDVISPAFGPAGEPRLRSWRRNPVDALQGATLLHFLETAPRRFFHGVLDLQAPGVVAVDNPGWLDEVVDEANQIVNGRFQVLGYGGLEFGAPIDWHHDVVSGRRSPRAHWSRIDPLDAEAIGDSKVIWEINRHQWMVTLAQAFRVTGDRRYAETILRRLDEWVLANPYPVGINWASSLEASLRLMAWCWTLMLIRDAPDLTEARFARWRTLICAHASHVERYLSHYFSPNTHLTGEALGLVYAGVVFADCPDAARWRDVGRQILVDELGRQVGADGVHFEQATCYQRYTIEIYLHFLLLAERNGIHLPEQARASVRRMVQSLVALLQPDRTMPALGDADGGWILPLVSREPHDCRGVLALAAVVFDDPEFAWAADGAAPEVFWFCGQGGVRALARVGVRPPVGPPSRILPNGGYVVMRSGWQPDAHQLIVDVGPLGCPVSGAHGHADLLSIQCAAFGETYLVDPGTYCYTADSTWRAHFRGTAAHNTVVVDGQHQADSTGPFSWGSRPAAKLTTWQSTSDHDFVDAEHDGYARLTEPVRHRRRVLFLKPSGWAVVDDVIGEGTHDLEIRFQFAPRKVSLEPGGWTRAEGSGGRGLWMVALARLPLTKELQEGGERPSDGWISPGYGVLRPAPVVTYRATMTGPLRVTTLILPASTMSAIPPLIELRLDAAGNVNAFRLPGDERTVLIASDAMTIEHVSGRQLIA